jgi:signal transduction histidine kinase
MNKSRILIVEDDTGLVEGIRTILELDQYKVLTAENGAQALEILNTESTLPDLIVSDIMMPVMDGIQFLKAVRHQAEWTHIPFIFLTAKKDRSDILNGKRLGVDDYLIKPFEAEELLITIEARLKRHRVLSAAHESNISNLKRSILTILNHEFRTPLTFVVAYADMISHHDTSRLTDSELLTFLKGVGTGAVRLRQLIENFILLVELETGDAQRTFNWRKSVVTDLPTLLEEARDRQQQIEPFQQTCAIRVAGNLPPFVADREYLMVALCQLLSNAVKFSPKEESIIIGAEYDGAYLLLRVRDYGRGIATAELESIWEMFYQIDRPIHEDKGTGSGLSIVRGIVEMHKGRVEVVSKAGEGSQFTIRLPLNQN